MNICIKIVLTAMVLAIGTAQQTYLTIVQYSDSKCTMVVAGFAFPVNQCISQTAVTSMMITSSSVGALNLVVYGSLDCSGTAASTTFVPYTAGTGCSALFLSGLYYTVGSNMFSTAASALQITTSLGAGAVIASYQDSGCTLQSAKASVTTNGLPGEMSFLANGQCGVNPFTLKTYFKNTCGGVGALKGSLNFYTDKSCTNLISQPTTSTISNYTISTRNQCSPVIPTVTNVGTYVPIFGLYAQGYCQGIAPSAAPTVGPTMTPTVSNLVVVNAMQDLGCSGCLLSTWGTGSVLAAYMAVFNLAMSTAIYNSLNMAAYGGFVNVTGLTQKTTTRRHLLAPTLTVAYTVRMNNPAVTATSIRSTLTSATTLTTIGATMSVAAASTVTAAAPTLTITGVGANTPTAAPSANASPSKNSASSLRQSSIYGTTVIVGSVSMMMLLSVVV